MTAVDTILIIIGSLTLLASVFATGLMLGQRHRRLRIVDVCVGVPKVAGSGFTECLIVCVMNPGSRPVVVEDAGLILEGGEEIAMYPEPVVNLDHPFREPLPPFTLTDGEASNLYRQAKGGVCQYLAENKGMGGQRVRFRPFVRYALGKRRRADTWWTVDVDSAEFTPDDPGRFRRLLIRVQHALQ